MSNPQWCEGENPEPEWAAFDMGMALFLATVMIITLVLQWSPLS